MHGYTAALVLPKDYSIDNDSILIEHCDTQNYVTISIKNPMLDPFNLIPNAYKLVLEHMGINQLTFDDFAYEHLYQEDGFEIMKIFIAIK